MNRIAVVDDNVTWCFALEALLSHHGYFVSTFSNADMFLPEAERFDLALIDFSIPTRPFQRKMDGPDLIRYVRQHFKNPPLLVLISSFFTEDLLVEASDLCPHADAYLTKGVETSELLSQIERLLSSRTSAKKGGDAKPQSRSTEAKELLRH